jgi:hypothetical protein
VAMMRFLGSSVFAFVMGMSLGAGAQVMLDMSKVTCGQLVAYKITNPKYISVWISGYYHGLHQKLTVDTQRLVENADKLEDYCLKNQEVPVLKAVETVLGPLE